MKRITKMRFFLSLLILCSILICTLCACGDKHPKPDPAPGDSSPGQADSDSEKGDRENTSIVLVPSADGTVTFPCDAAVIDASHTSDGYIMVNYTGTNPKVKLQITGADTVTYTYNLHGGDYEVFPLTAGDGSYQVTVFENVSGTQYSTALSQSINAAVTNEFGPFLYPNQYVNFDSSTKTVALGEELAYSADDDIEVVQNVYNYVIDHISYDYDKAKTVESGYLPVIDDVLDSGTGICFDYASVMAAMLRTQNIPTRLQIGYKGEEYHAWISIHTDETGWINGIIEFDGEDWKLMDPTFASTSKSPEDFIANDTDYITKYVY